MKKYFPTKFFKGSRGPLWLHGREEMYRTLVERANDGITIIQDEKLVYANPRLSEITGYSLKELVGTSFTHFIHPHYLPQVQELYRRRMEGENVVTVYETVLKHKDGSNVYVELNPGLIQYRGKTSNMVIVRDVTERHRAERALVESEKKYREILSSIEECYYEVDLQGNFRFFNDKLCHHTGYNREELEGQNYSILAKDPRQVFDAYNSVFRSNQPVGGYTWNLVKKDGSEISVDVSISLIRDEEGNATGFRGIARDVTAREKKEEEKTFERKRFEALFKNSTEAIAFVDEHYRVEDINERFTELFGYTLQEVYGKRLNEVIPLESKGEIDWQIMQQIIQEGEAVSIESSCVNRNGEKIDVFLKGIPVVIGGEVKGGYAIYADITERKRYEEKLWYLSAHDHLTGVFNRMYFEEEMNRLEGSREYPISIFVADLDSLKMVNDALGHDVGDELIKACAKVLSTTIRSNDLLARIGGDEFALIFPRTSAEVAESIKKRIKNSLAEFRDNNPDVMLYLSIGSATTESPAYSLWNTFKKADHNMFREKVEHGRVLKNKISESITRAKIRMS